MTNRTTFTRRQVRTLIQMAEVFKAVAREHPGTEFPWGSVAWRPEWFMDDALPVLERTAALNGIDAGSSWFTALAGTFAADIARWVRLDGGAWDRSTNRGSFATLELAVAAIRDKQQSR